MNPTIESADGSQSLAIVGGTVIDGNGGAPVEGGVVLVEGKRILSIGDRFTTVPSHAKRIAAHGKYIIPGLLDANVHLLGDVRFENLLRHEGRYENLIAEAAQVALKGGLTTVFDTWGPRGPLISVRDRINSGDLVGSRIFCAGNIIGLDGPFSQDFNAKTLDIASAALVERINALWASNVGPALSWMTPDQVAQEVSTYIAKGIDFVKYASSEHRWGDPTTFLVFSPKVQAAIVEVARRAGTTAQAHATSVESLRVAIEAGCDIIQHCNTSGPVPIPETTLQLLADRKTAAVVFAFTKRRYDWIMETCPTDRKYFAEVDNNCRRLIDSDAVLLMAGDASIMGADAATDPAWSKYWFAPGEDNLMELGQGHFHWLKAMEEKGLSPMEALKAATRNIAVAYKKDKDIGTLGPGKIADLLILDKNPLKAAENYRSIYMILKEGTVVDRSSLPQSPILTKPGEPPSAETLAYRAHRYIGASGQPHCC